MATRGKGAGQVTAGETRGAMGAGLVTGCGDLEAARSSGGGWAALNSSEIFGISLAPMPSRSRQLRLSLPVPFVGVF